MKKISLFIVCLLCLCISGCVVNQKQFSYALKPGKYISEESFSYNNIDITYFELELNEGNIMRYVKTDGENMIKDLYTINEKFYTVYDVNLTMCINGENKLIIFDKVKSSNYQTTLKYKVIGLDYPIYDTKEEYELFKSFTLETIDEDGDLIAEKLLITIDEITFIVENQDVPYIFTLNDEKGLFGTTGTIETTYLANQTVTLYVNEVVSYDDKYLMPIIIINDEMIKPYLDITTSVYRWGYSFEMPNYDIVGVVVEIEVEKSSVITKVG